MWENGAMYDERYGVFTFAILAMASFLRWPPGRISPLFNFFNYFFIIFQCERGLSLRCGVASSSIFCPYMVLAKLYKRFGSFLSYFLIDFFFLYIQKHFV